MARRRPGTLAGRMLQAVVKGTRQIQREKVDPFGSMYGKGGVIEPPLPLDSLLSMYEVNTFHAAAIDAKVQDAVGRGFTFEAVESATDDEADEVDPDAGPEDADDAASEADQVNADLAAALDDLCADAGMTFAGLLDQAATDEMRCGWGVWEVSRADDRVTVDGLYPLPGQTLRAVLVDDPDGEPGDKVVAYVQIVGEKKRYFRPFGAEFELDAATGKPAGDDAAGDELANEVLIFRRYNPRSAYYGLPPWVACTPAIAELTAIREYNVSWFESGGQADRIVTVNAAEKSVAEEAAESIRKQVLANRGKGHLTLFSWGTEDVKVDVKQLSPGTAGQRDGQFQRRRDDLVKEVLIAHKVPPYRVGWAEVGSLGGNAAKEMLRAYREGAVEPIQGLIEATLAATLFDPGQGIVPAGYRFQLDELDWEQLEVDTDRAAKAVEHGLMTPNDGREEIGLPRLDGRPELDRFYFRGAPLDDADAAGAFAERVGEFEKALWSTVNAIEDRGES